MATLAFALLAPTACGSSNDHGALPDSGSDAPAVADATQMVSDATAEAGPEAASSPCGAYNGDAGCTPTEQRFAAVSLDCYQCLVTGGCLDDTVSMDKGRECGDLSGSATAGAQTGTADSDLCLATIDCALRTGCATNDVTLCYCGSLGEGCATSISGADGACLQQEVDGLNHLASDPASQIIVDYLNPALGSGVANQIFVCAESNGCGALCSAAIDAGADAQGQPGSDAGDAGLPESGAVDSGVPPIDATADVGAPDARTPGILPDGAVSPCSTDNGGSGCTATEQLFLDKSPDCYSCLVNGDCLDNAVFADVNLECGDLGGAASGGALAGTANADLCLDVLRCVLQTDCESSDINICYCGSLGAGNQCATAVSGANGSCVQQSADGTDHLVTDPPLQVLPDIADDATPTGRAFEIFVCAKSNSCLASCM